MWEWFKEYSGNLMLILAGLILLVTMGFIFIEGEARIIEDIWWVRWLDVACGLYAMGLGIERQIRDMRK